MQRRSFLRLAPLSLVGYGLAAQARPGHISSEATELFDRAAARHMGKMRDLGISRGLSEVSPGPSQTIPKALTVQSSFIQRGVTAYSDGTAILFYFYDYGKLYSWLINETGIQAFSQNKISRLAISNSIQNLRRSLNVDELQEARSPRQKASVKIVFPNTEEARRQAIMQVSQLLLPRNIANSLEDVKHLIIVPVFELGTVPYAMLKPFKDDESVLLDSMSISIASGLEAAIQPLNKSSIQIKKSPLILGNPYLPQNDSWVIPPLPGAEKEAAIVAEMLESKAFLGQDATKEKVLMEIEKSSLLYFATHGIASSDDPLLGGFLMLSANEFEEGWLNAKEIQEMNLNADLAVLSACQTGLGKVHDAGMIGLARAFQLAGVPRVVMSLWNVDDQATSDLMQEFMKHLDHEVPSEGLRQAMLTVRQKYSDPAKWASFTMFGTPR